MTIFRQKLKSPVKQELIWASEYSDGTFETEFDLQTQTPKPFMAIRRKDLIRFGLIGADIPMYFETFGGNFNVAGRGIQVIYREGETDHYLIGNPKIYSNILYFKRGVAELDLTGGRQSNGVVGWGKPEGEVVEFNFGYNERIESNGVKFNFKALVTVPFQEPVKMTFTLGADREMNGHLIIMRNGVEVETISAPLDEEEGGEVEWTVV